MIDFLKTTLKNWPSWVLFLAGFAGLVASYFSSKQDSEQKDNIERLQRENNTLSVQTQRLTNLTNLTAEQIKLMSKENNALAIRNGQLADNNNALIERVNVLVESTQQVVRKLEQQASYTAAENLASGTLLDFGGHLKETDLLTIHIGGFSFGNDVSSFMGEHTSQPINIGGNLPVEIKVINGKIIIDARVYDFGGNLIAEVIQNSWRPNRNFIGKFNYDEHGFEVIDNQGNIALSISIVNGNRIDVQGLFYYPHERRIIIAGPERVIIASYPVNLNDWNTPDERGISPADKLHQDINKASFKPLFKYTGNNWLHQRN